MSKFTYVLPLMGIFLGSLVAVKVPLWILSKKTPAPKLELKMETINLTAIDDPLTLYNAWKLDARNLPSWNFDVEKMVLGGVESMAPFALTIDGVSTCDKGFKFFANLNQGLGKRLENGTNVTLSAIWTFMTADGKMGTRNIAVVGETARLPLLEDKDQFKSESVNSKLKILLHSQMSHERSRNNRELMAKNLATLLGKYNKNPTTTFQFQMPSSWGGFIVMPHSIDFYQETRDTIGDRIRFSKMRNSFGALPDGVYPCESKGWVWERLDWGHEETYFIHQNKPMIA